MGDAVKRIIVFTSGGIILTKRSPAVGGAVPAIKGDEFLSLLPRGAVDLVFEEVSNLPSSHMTPAGALELGRRVESALLAPDIEGAVVVHGADTLEESAYMLDLTIKNVKPIVVTGALRPASGVGYDGIGNLAGAIRLATAPEARDMGTLVVFGDEVYAASEVQQMHSESPAAFQSPGSGPLGRIDGQRISLRHRPTRRQYIPCARLEEMVDLIRLGQGVDDRQLRHSLDDGVAGVVLETFGSGRVPPWWLPSINEAARRRTVIVIATRCAAGGLGDEHGYVGAYHDLRRANLLFAHNLSGVKARIKLMVALGAARNMEELRGWFKEG
jgi:L-asparaginase